MTTHKICVNRDKTNIISVQLQYQINICIQNVKIYKNSMCAQRQHEASKQTWRNHLGLCKLQIFQRSQSPSKNHFEASNNDSKWRLPFLLNEGYQYICCHHWNNGLYWYEIGYLSHACIQHSKNLVRASKAEVASAHAQQRLGQLRLSGIFGARHILPLFVSWALIPGWNLLLASWANWANP